MKIIVFLRQFCFFLFFFIVCVLPQRINSLRLDANYDMKFLVGKKVGFYAGSFDPLHLGHQHVVESALKKQYVDYILIYPVYGEDNFKIRQDLKWRQQMLANVYEDHPQVLITDMAPLELQNIFMPYNKQIEIIGVIGSDVVVDKLLSPDHELRNRIQKGFMRGNPIPPEYLYHTIGSLMALRADSFIVALRSNLDLSSLEYIEDRLIVGFIQSFELSSSEVRKAIRSSRTIKDKVSREVQKVIEQEQLYQ